MNKLPIFYLIIPCFNEAEVLPTSAPVFLQKMEQLQHQNKIDPASKIVFVDDGSTDTTWQQIVSLHQQHPCVSGLKLAGNCGQQKALLAGFNYSQNQADCAISFDVDLQDDINVLDQFVEKYTQGAEIVYGVRNDRKSDSFFKKYSAQCFYKLMNYLGVHLIYNHSECRLLGSKAMQALAQYSEQNLFLRGIILQLGFKTDIVYYARHQRAEGTSKYSLLKLMKIAVEALTSFSMLPIRIISLLGLAFAGVSLLVFLFFVAAKFFGTPFPGYASLICSIWFIGGVQLFAISIIGEYVGKTYIEAKRRPRYIIEQELE